MRGNIGAEIDVIKPALPAQTHAPIAIHFAFGVSRALGIVDHLRRRFAHFKLCAHLRLPEPRPSFLSLDRFGEANNNR
jgi:hypothetical protein